MNPVSPLRPLATLFAALAALLLAAPLPPLAESPTAETLTATELDLESFEVVWRTVNDRYWDPAIGGLDWQAVHDELRPELLAAETSSGRRGIIDRMLQRLGKSHFALLRSNPGDGGPESGGRSPGPAGPGLDLRVIEGRALVVRVDAGSPGAQAGVRPGWVLEAVDGREIRELITETGKQHQGSTSLGFFLNQAIALRLSGSEGESLTARFLDGKLQRREVTLSLAHPRGKIASFGNLPPTSVWVETRTLEGSPGQAPVGVVAFNLFLDPPRLMPALEKAVLACDGCAGMVIDLRGNPGGIGAMAMGMAGWFTAEKGLRLGTMHTRESTLNFAIFPRARTFQGPLAILIDESSASTSEILAGGLRDLGRARIFGRRSAGASLPSVIVKLPNGDGFQYAIADYISEGGQSLEGQGVTPDEIVVPTREQLLAGADPVLDAALTWIRNPQEKP